MQHVPIEQNGYYFVKRASLLTGRGYGCKRLPRRYLLVHSRDHWILFFATRLWRRRGQATRKIIFIFPISCLSSCLTSQTEILNFYLVFCFIGFRVIFTGTVVVIPDIMALASPGERAECRRESSQQKNSMIGNEGMRGLRALGVRDLSYRIAFIANSVQVAHRSTYI